MTSCKVCGAWEYVWLDLQPDGTWLCRDRLACQRRLMRKRQDRLFSAPDDQVLQRCAAGAAQVDRAVTAFRTPHEPPRFEPPAGALAA